MYHTYMSAAPWTSPTSPRTAQSEVLVTGASGNVGRHVVELLVAAGVPVRAASPDTRHGAVALDHGAVRDDPVRPVVLDFTDARTWPDAFTGVRQVFVMRPPHLSRPRTQMLPALEAAKAAGVERMVLLSLQGADHNPVVPHAALESWMRSSGLSWTFVRPSFFMQNLTTTHVADIRDRDTLVVPAGNGLTSFVDAADVAAVAAAALLDPGAHDRRAWTPTGPEALSYEEVADVLSATLGRTIRYTRPGLLRYARHAHRTLGMPWSMVGVTSAIYTVARLGRAGGLTDDVRTVTGRAPVSLRAFALANAGAWAR